MSLDYIKETYRVPAEIGQKVRFAFNNSTGEIVGANGAHVIVRWLDGPAKGETSPLHPTWQLNYLDQDAEGGE